MTWTRMCTSCVNACVRGGAASRCVYPNVLHSWGVKPLWNGIFWPFEGVGPLFTCRIFAPFSFLSKSQILYSQALLLCVRSNGLPVLWTPPCCNYSLINNAGALFFGLPSHSLSGTKFRNYIIFPFASLIGNKKKKKKPNRLTLFFLVLQPKYMSFN